MLLVAGPHHSFAGDVENSCHFRRTNHIVQVSRPALDWENPFDILYKRAKVTS